MTFILIWINKKSWTFKAIYFYCYPKAIFVAGPHEGWRFVWSFYLSLIKIIKLILNDSYCFSIGIKGFSFRKIGNQWDGQRCSNWIILYVRNKKKTYRNLAIPDESFEPSMISRTNPRRKMVMIDKFVNWSNLKKGLRI